MRLIRAGYISALALVASLLLARVHPFGDAGLHAPKIGSAPMLESSSVSPEVRAILINKCADCHSTQTHAPAYARFAPISWLMERDIVEGRKHMNLSSWDSYTESQQETLRAKIVQQTKAHEMPLPQYRMIHWNARITDADVQAFTQWSHGGDALAAVSTSQAVVEGDPVRGEAVFEKRCTGCHSLTQNHEGPRLQGVYGRTTGSVAGFPYSDALKKAHVVWGDDSLEKWLADPDAFVPGNNMDFHVAKPQERRDLVRFLRQGASGHSG